MTTTRSLPPWAARLLGEAAVVDVLDGGTSRATLLVEVPPDGRRLVARHDSGTGPLSGTGFTLEREAAAFQFAAAVGVPVPDVVACSDDGLSIAITEVPGVVESGAVALDHYLEVLGRLHRAPLDGLPSGHVAFDPAGRDDLAVWEAAARSLPEPNPLLDYAFDVLVRHRDDIPAEAVFCHGDAGPGNYLHDGGRVTGLIDWEMAHTGDPHDDLASVAVRATLSGVELGDYADRVRRHWAPAAGRAPDPRRYRVATLAVLTRMVVSCHLALAHPDPGQDRTVQLMGLPLMEVHLLREAAALEARSLDPVTGIAPDPAFLARMASVIGEHAEHAEGAANQGRARRVRYLTAQLVAALADTGASAPEPQDRLRDLWVAAHRRVAALPRSKALADTPIPGVT